ncbi:MAG: MBL fold metallo-hydrolase [Rudaea sp.]
MDDPVPVRDIRKLQSSYAADELVFEQGALATSMFVVLEGAVRIVDHSGDTPKVIARMGAGEFFGEIALVDGGIRDAAVFAAHSPTRLAEIDRARFMYLVSQQPAFALTVIRTLCQRLRRPECDEHMETPPSGARIIEYFPGIWQVVGTHRAAHAWLVCGTRRNILIDSGLPTTFDLLCAALADAGLRPDDLDLVVLSHEHIEHSGGAVQLARCCPIAAHHLAANKLALRDEFTVMSRAFAAQIDAFQIDILLEHGCCIDAGGVALHVIHTPGHCSGSICLLEPSRRILFSAGTIMANGILGGVLGSGNASDYISSLEKLASLRIDYLMPGHGNASDHAAADIDAGIKKLHALLDDSHALFSVLRDTGRGHDDVMRSLRDLNSL